MSFAVCLISFVGLMKQLSVTIPQFKNNLDISEILRIFSNLSSDEKERLLLKRQKEKLEKNLGSISELNRLPAALFIVDVKKEHIAVKEAKRLNIPTFAIVDTNSDPKLIDFPIPANDDAAKSIAKIMEIVSGAVNEGLSERKATKEKKVEAKPKSEEVAAETKEEAKA